MFSGFLDTVEDYNFVHDHLDDPYDEDDYDDYDEEERRFLPGDRGSDSGRNRNYV